MSSAILKINWQPKRMLTKSESAHHCGRSVKQFQVECPVAPLVMGNGDLRWDVRELDRCWIASGLVLATMTPMLSSRGSAHDRDPRQGLQDFQEPAL